MKMNAHLAHQKHKNEAVTKFHNLHQAITNQI